MLEQAENAIARANRLVSEHQIEGWMGANIHHLVDFADGLHQEMRTKGDILEIGIHHGRLFFVMAAAARDDEQCIAIDLFDNQALNVDHSGQGSKSTFLGYVADVFPEVESRLRIIEGDSMSLTVPSLKDRLGTEGVRIFSVDGGHTRHHAVNDLCLAQELTVGGGLILLDDFLGPHWPAVTEGFFHFMSVYNRRLAPVMIFENKLFLTTFSEHQMMLDGLRSRMEQVFGDQFPIRWKYSDLCGFQVLGCS